MSDFFSIYSSIGRRGSFLTEAALSVDSNRDVSSRGNSHTDKTMSPDLRDKVLTARIQEIEAFAKDRGIEPLIAMGASEAALRTGRVPNLTMYGMAGDNMVALKHFIAGEILNLAGMEAINWDGTPISEEEIEEADAAPPSHHAIATRLSGVVERHFLKDLNGVKDEETGAFRKFRTKLQGHIKSLLNNEKHDTSDPHWHQLHIALSAPGNQNEVVGKGAPESIHNFVNSDREDKSDQGKPQERWGVPKQEADPYEEKRKGGKVGGPKPQTSDVEINGQLQQEYAADRGGSAVSNLNGTSISSKPTEVGKKKIQGDMSKQTIAKIKKGQSEVQRNEKTGEKGDKKAPMMATDLNGLSGKDVGKLGRELGAMGTGETGESVEIKNKDLLNIEPGDFRNESWPKMGADLKRLLNVESRNMSENTMTGSVGSFMQLGNQIVARPNTIASWDASVDVNGFHPARLGMITPDPVHPVNEARRYRDADAAAEFVASKKLITKSGIHPNVALHKGDDGSIHVQLRGAEGKDGTHPNEDPGNEDEKFHELTRSERGKFLAQPAAMKARTKTTMTGVPGKQTVEPDTKRNKAMNAIRTLRAAAAAIK